MDTQTLNRLAALAMELADLRIHAENLQTELEEVKAELAADESASLTPKGT